MTIKKGLLRIIAGNYFKELPVGSYIWVTESKYDEKNGHMSYIESLDGKFKKWVLDVVLVWYTRRLDGGL